MKVAFVQPFSLTCASGGGGGRILRGALRAAPVPVISCNTSLFDHGLSRETFRERWLPYRPHLGRIEKTRFSWLPDMLDEFWWRLWRGKLLHFLQSEKVTHLHVVPHSGLDFAAANWCANRMGIPIAVSVHDHPRYCFKGSGRSIRRLQLFGQLWQSADTRFVISAELGDALNLEFGAHPFLVVTDGVRVGPFINRGNTKDKVHLYFMGLYHNSYNANFQKLLEALEAVGKSIPSMQFVLTLRCGSSPPLSPPANVVLRVLPFSSEEDVAKDMEIAGILYLPLPFGREYETFVRYSVSTKMISYLSSGRPILYHGPDSTPAHNLLQQNGAALICPTEDPSLLADQLMHLLSDENMALDIARAAWQLAKNRFNPNTIHSGFWNQIMKGA